MKFSTPLIPGRLIRRYKRFLADITLDDTAEKITAHCANPGAMTGLQEPGSRVWLSKSDNPKRKLKYSWEMVEADNGAGTTLVGINTAHPNRIVKQALSEGAIEPLAAYRTIRPEQRYGVNSRVDFLLEQDGLPPCYLEIKNVHLMREAGLAEFPDSVTARGAKHLDELAEMKRQGARAVMLYLVQRCDATRFALARDIDPVYAARFQAAREAGIEALVYRCALSTSEIRLNRAVTMTAP